MLPIMLKCDLKWTHLEKNTDNYFSLFVLHSVFFFLFFCFTALFFALEQTTFNLKLGVQTEEDGDGCRPEKEEDKGTSLLIECMTGEMFHMHRVCGGLFSLRQPLSLCERFFSDFTLLFLRTLEI